MKRNPELEAQIKDFNKKMKKRSAIVREFYEFINRGNVIDLAVGVIVGGAFQRIITSIVNDILSPLLGIMLGGVDFSALEIVVPNFFGSGDAAHIAYGKFLQSTIDFLIVALCIFIFVKFMNKLARKSQYKKDTKDTKETKAEKDVTTTNDTNEEILKTLKSIDKKLSKND